MHFGVNLLTEIFRDTYTLRHQRQAVLLTVLTGVPYESTCTWPIKPEFTEAEVPHTSPLTHVGKQKEGEGRGEEKRKKRRREKYACIREQLGATNERARRRGNRDRRSLRQAQRQQTPANWADIF